MIILVESPTREGTMRKPARVVLPFHKVGYALWKALADKADETAIYEHSDGGVAAALTVEHFSMSAQCLCEGFARRHSR
jgi:hypothetical protein